MRIIPEKFWRKVRKTRGCWVWTACCASGYGSLRVGSRMVGAHRASYILHKGKIPRGLFVLHKCDNKKCVNPQHLFVGTQKRNMDDMRRKGRQALGRRLNHGDQRGSNNHGAKLTEPVVRRIKSLRRKGMKQTRIAKLTKTTKTTKNHQSQRVGNRQRS